MMITSAERKAAERLAAAVASRVACAPVRDLLGAVDVSTAYAVQQLAIAGRLADGRRVSGRKVGLTNPKVQAQLGVTQPDFGVLFDDMARADGGAIAYDELLQPKIEAEVAFVLASDLDQPGPIGPREVREAVAYVVAALEIVDSRIRDWDISIVDTIADNASCGLYVLGAERVSLRNVVPADVAMTLSRDGTVVSSGSGHDCLGDPLAAVAWLAETVRDHGSPLRAGEVVLSGALGPMVSVEPGATYAAQVSALGGVSATFGGVSATFGRHTGTPIDTPIGEETG